MPIISTFPGGSGSGGGIALGGVTDIKTQVSHGKVYLKWTDPEDVTVETVKLAEWAGTVLVRKAGSTPANRRDGTIVVDSTTRNQYQNKYYTDSGLSDGTTYYYKFFPYSTTGTYTNDEKSSCEAAPKSIAPGNVSGLSAVASGNGKVALKWTDPDNTVNDGVTVSVWGGTKIVYKEESAPTGVDDGTLAKNSTTKNEHSTNGLVIEGLTNGTTYYFGAFPYADAETGGAVNTAEDNTTTGVPNLIKITTEPSQDGALTYNGTNNTDGTAQSPKWKNYSDTQLTLSVTPQSATGTYDATFTPKEDYCWNDGTAAEQTIAWSIGKKPIEKVTSTTTSFTYNKTGQFPTWTNYDAGTIAIGGDSEAKTNAGSYSTTFTPLSNFQWTTGDSAAVSISWTIAKASCTATYNKTTVNLSSSTTSDIVAITTDFDGTISAESKSSSICSATVSGKNVTIKTVNNTTGNTTVEITYSGGANYTPPAKQSITVNASFMPAKAALNSMSWADIKKVSDAGQGSNYFAVGDRKSISINGTVGTLSVSGTYWVYILGFDHNTSYEPKGITFGGFKNAATGGTDIAFVDSNYYKTDSTGKKYFSMNHWGSDSSPYNTNYGGWAACDMRYDILGSTNQQPTPYGSVKTTSATGKDPTSVCATTPVSNTLMAALPSDLRAVMKAMTKYTDNTGNSSNTSSHVTKTTDYLPLLSEYEVFGTRSCANEYEKDYQKQYAYYSASNSKVKYKHSATTDSCNWWLRSPLCTNGHSFCLVTTAGSATSNTSRLSYGLAPAFIV